MTDFTKVKANLEKRGYAVSCFATAAEAAGYLDGKLNGKTIGIGGSVTVREMGLLDRLKTHNTVVSHWEGSRKEDAAFTQVYLCSVNGLAETGEMVNIDGVGNRIASTVFGHEELYLVVGRNKLAPDYDGAVWRARNVASPKNAIRLQRKTPLRRQGGQVLRLQQLRAAVPGHDGAVAGIQRHRTYRGRPDRRGPGLLRKERGRGL